MNNADFAHIEERLIQMVAERCPFWANSGDVPPIGPETNIFRDLEFDSLMLVVLQIDIEDAFHIRFDPTTEDFRSIFSTIHALSSCVKQHLEIEYEQ